MEVVLKVIIKVVVVSSRKTMFLDIKTIVKSQEYLTKNTVKSTNMAPINLVATITAKPGKGPRVSLPLYTAAYRLLTLP